MKLMDKAKQAALAAAVKTGLSYLEKDPEVNIPKLMELVDKFVPDGWYESQRNAIRNAIQDKDSNWYKLILRIYELDPGRNLTELERCFVELGKALRFGLSSHYRG
mgnify:CR=1 FL=1